MAICIARAHAGSAFDCQIASLGALLFGYEKCPQSASGKILHMMFRVRNLNMGFLVNFVFVK